MRRVFFTLTPEQETALQDSAKQAGTSESEIVRRCLVACGVIPEAIIKRGGYRERRKPQEKKDEDNP
jgi:hypothetical protein